MKFKCDIIYFPFVDFMRTRHTELDKQIGIC